MAHAAYERLARLPATFSAAEARAAGVWSRELQVLRDSGTLIQLSWGVYRKADAPETAHLDLLAVSHRAPIAVVCLVSALALHELTDEVPPAVQIAVPRGTAVPQISYPPTEVSKLDAATFDLGRTQFEAAPGEYVHVYDPARSVVDAMRLRSRVGESLALRALRLYLAGRGARPTDLLRYARALDVEGPVQRAVEAVLS